MKRTISTKIKPSRSLETSRSISSENLPTKITIPERRSNGICKQKRELSRERSLEEEHNSSKNYIFLARVTKGHLIKVLIDLFLGSLERVTFMVDKLGIRISEMDDAGTILFNVEIKGTKIQQFICNKPINFSFKLRDAKQMFNNVKKKDSIAFFIENNGSYSQRNNFYISIVPEGSSDGIRSSYELSYIKFKEEPDKTPIDQPVTEYLYPFKLSSTNFQKIKKLVHDSSKIRIKQISNETQSKFLFVESESEGIMGSRLCFGNEEDREGDDTVYDKEFHSHMINNLVKIPSLSEQILFSIPKGNSQNVLLISLDICQSGFTLGKVKIFVKTIEQIDYELTLKEKSSSPDEEIPQKLKPKKNLKNRKKSK